jgi:Luciferase
MTVRDASAQIQAALLEWPDVTTHPHCFGGVEYRLGARELGHVHGDHLVDIPFPTRVRDEVVATGLAEPHHILPDSGWVSLYLRAPADVKRAIDLLRRSFELAQRKWSVGQEPRTEN